MKVKLQLSILELIILYLLMINLKQASEVFDSSFPKIITIARLDKRKNQNILMTIKNLKTKFPKIKYISIGDGERKEELSEL